MPTTLTTDNIVRIKDLIYENAVTKLHKLAIDISSYSAINKSILIGDVTDIAVAEAKIYTDSILAGLVPKGNLSGVFNSATIDPADYDLYYVTTNGSYDSDLDETYSRGLIYWLTNNWVVLYSEAYLQAQITAVFTASMYYAGTISADFDITTLTGIRTGWIYKLTKRVKETEQDVYYFKGLIYSNADTSQTFTQLTEECRSQELTIDASNQVTVTDFTLTNYQLIDNDSFQKSNCSVIGQVITYPGGAIGTTVTVLNLS